MEETKRVSVPVRFGIFEVDLHSGELRRQGYRVKLQDQPFQLLIMLLEHPGDVITREELQRQLWPADTFVDFERGLNRAINKLREALGDDADAPHFIETLPRRAFGLRGRLWVRVEEGAFAGQRACGGCLRRFRSTNAAAATETPIAPGSGSWKLSIANPPPLVPKISALT